MRQQYIGIDAENCKYLMYYQKEKNNKGAMDMRKDMKAGNPDIIDNPESEKLKDPSKKAPLRKGDNAQGDKNIIPSATPAKGN